jgi:hypothetical protein
MGGDPMTAIPVRTKQPDEIRTVPFDFAPKLASGVVLTGAPTTFAAAGVTIVGATVVGAQVLVQVSGGTLATTYKVTCRIGATNGDVLELDVNLRIAEEN